MVGNKEIVESQFQHVKRNHPTAQLLRQDDGSFVVHLPRLPLPVGWFASEADVWFEVPEHYPEYGLHFRFFTDESVRLLSGAPPQQTFPMDVTWSDKRKQMFLMSWPEWRCGKDSLSTFFHMIRQRFAEAT